MFAYRAKLENLEKMGNLETREQRWVAFLLLLCAFQFHFDVYCQWAGSFAGVSGIKRKADVHFVTAVFFIQYLFRVKQENKDRWGLQDLQA